MAKHELKVRTQRFAVAVIRFAQTLPCDPVTLVIVRQMTKSGTSVGANYRAACRAKSVADFIAKMGIVEEEADVTLYWFDVLVEAGIVKPSGVADLAKEGNEILAMVVSSIKTARGRQE